MGVEMPFLRGGLFDYASNIYNRTQTYRIGGLSEAGTLGISAMIALYYRKPWSARFVLLMCLFLFLMVMSGGRAAGFGVVSAFLCYTFFIEPGKCGIGKGVLLSLLLAVLLLISMQIGLLENYFFSPSVKTVLTVLSRFSCATRTVSSLILPPAAITCLLTF